LALLLPQGDPDPTTVTNALTAVFRQRVYNRSISGSVLDRITEWLGRQLVHAVGIISHTPGRRWAFAIALLCVVIAMIVHAVTSRVGDAARAEWTGARRRGESNGDPWALAQRLAAAGDYTEAAHALYQGLLRALARRDNIRLHESKTVGDYSRELRARASQRSAPFREFARTYEVVVYGLGTCDRDRYDRLHSLAQAITTAQHG
jgi:Domain of unknown function (DUF4129)